MNSIPFDLLRVLIAVAESKNFRDAAEKLKISQPAVSLKLKELESFQPLALFSLEGKRKVLTPFGRSLYELAKEGSLSLERKIENLHRVYSSADLLTVRIGGRNEVLEYIAPFLDFAGKIEFMNCTSTEAVDRLLRHEVDIAISYIRPDSAEVQAKKLFKSPAYFAVHKKLTPKRRLTEDLIRDRNFLLNTPCISYYRDGHLIDDWCKHTNIKFENLKVKFVAEDWRTIQSLVDQGAGYAIVPFYVQSKSPEVERIELPKEALDSLDFFALFETGLKKIPAFKSLLTFNLAP